MIYNTSDTFFFVISRNHCRQHSLHHLFQCAWAAPNRRTSPNGSAKIGCLRLKMPLCPWFCRICARFFPAPVPPVRQNLFYYSTFLQNFHPPSFQKLVCFFAQICSNILRFFVPFLILYGIIKDIIRIAIRSDDHVPRPVHAGFVSVCVHPAAFSGHLLCHHHRTGRSHGFHRGCFADALVR